MKEILVLAIGGSFGAILRYLISQLDKYHQFSLPLATLFIRRKSCQVANESCCFCATANNPSRLWPSISSRRSAFATRSTLNLSTISLLRLDN